MESFGNRSSRTSAMEDQISRVFLRRGSAFDAWLTATTVQVAQVLLTLPHSFAQMGLASGVVFQLLYGALGCWSCYMTTSLYADYIWILDSQKLRKENHIIQWYEVLEALLGRWWKALGLLFNCMLMLSAATIQLVACGNTVWYINDNLDKRTWTYIFGAICFSTLFIRMARNYHLWMFLGVFMTSYTAWYMTIAALFFEKHQNAVHTGPTSSVEYFTGTTNIIYTFGSHALTLEIIEAMDQPRKFKFVYVYAILYILTLTLPSAISVYWRFGDKMLEHPNALAVFSPSKFKTIAVILMLAHQIIEFAAFIVPVFAMWEKMLGIHHSNNQTIKYLARIPIVLIICLFALMLPFFGSINSVVGSFLSSIAVYILPCVAFMVIRRHEESRENAIEQPPVWIFNSWVGVYCINLGIVLWVAIVGMGFGAWASMYSLFHKVERFGLFSKCFECNKL
ncbi:hypothetical protein SELMODRAFT_104259 [Selaginella moellendorffii]|uniref:Amino acid transporter transmembrane domain-containing protein n=1 Tax=Selaginella moellendorffii TaxID=88036 RepID=D8RYL3_SELML|nr:hypothetical protein SELMODRAFT_104259 [Selaginella moellendorffii]